MIIFDKDVLLALKKLEKEGHRTYAYGECNKAGLGLKIYDWDLMTDGTIEEAQKLFPEGNEISSEILRVDYTYLVEKEEDGEVLETYEEGAIMDLRCNCQDFETILKDQWFTILAQGEHPEKPSLDPFKGKEDMKKKLISTTYDGEILFKENPIAMLKAVRLVGETGFDLSKEVYEGILNNWKGLSVANKIDIRDELELLLVGDFAGKGLNMLAGTGLITPVLGEEVASKLSASEMSAFETLCKKIDETQKVPLRRLGLFYTILEKKRALQAIEELPFEPEEKVHLVDAAKEMINIQFLGEAKMFKKFLFEMGLERYEYIHNLSKAQRIVFDHPATKIESRNYMMKTIQTSREPVFIEDLAIDANDVMEAGYANTPEEAEELLKNVVAVVHMHPDNNQRKYLMKIAKKFSKSKFAVATRYIKWLR